VTSFHDHIVAVVPKLRRFTVALTGNIADGDDLLQSALERALKRQLTYQPDRKFDSWIFKIAQNIWIDQKRAEKRRGYTVGIDEAYDLAGENGTKTVEDRSITQKVLSAISNLPEEQKLVVTYVLVDGQSYKEAAANLDTPVGTVMSRLHRARQALNTIMIEQ